MVVKEKDPKTWHNSSHTLLNDIPLTVLHISIGKVILVVMRLFIELTSLEIWKIIENGYYVLTIE